jgi:copper chaperone NosL
MKTIEPDSIPELRILPPALVGLSLLGMIGAWWGRRWLLTTWLLLLLAGSLAGLADFWWWEYDYGHNLDPNAAIKVPGMSYQPPLIGTKQLLNMRTTAMPGLGALAIGAGLAIGLFAWRSPRPASAPRKGSAMAPRGRAALALGVLMLASVGGSCQAGPRDIRYRQDTCARCRMFVMDERYGAELVTKRGKVLTFDSAECLAAHTLESPKDAKEAQALLVTHHARPRQLATAEGSVYLKSTDLPSPMGLGLTACADTAEAVALRARHSGELLSWPQVLDHVRIAWRIP